MLKVTLSVYIEYSKTVNEMTILVNMDTLFTFLLLFYITFLIFLLIHFKCILPPWHFMLCTFPRKYLYM